MPSTTRSLAPTAPRASRLSLIRRSFLPATVISSQLPSSTVLISVHPPIHLSISPLLSFTSSALRLQLRRRISDPLSASSDRLLSLLLSRDGNYELLLLHFLKLLENQSGQRRVDFSDGGGSHQRAASLIFLRETQNGIRTKGEMG
ncbi:hypothetical protein LINGRAHAP2_LOCUS27958 [Linum grandiflorum]